MRKEKGITLVALIITIIIMLILVAVSVNILIKSNLIGTAEKAANGYKTAYERENDGSITINGKEYSSIDEYMDEVNPPIIEPNDVKDWEYSEGVDGLYIVGYLNTDKTIDTVVIPNYINGKPVFNISGGLVSGGRPTNMWNSAICEGELKIQNSNTSWTISKNSTIRKVIVSNGIEHINNYTFAGSEGIEEIILPKTLKSIEGNVFLGCINLKKITIPSGIGSISYMLFADCTSLKEVTIPSGVTGIDGYAFHGCTSLQEITIPNSVTSIGEYAFRGCTRLTEITIPSSVTTMEGNVFRDIPSITVHVPWKEDEKKPEGWKDNWNLTDTGCTVTISYAK